MHSYVHTYVYIYIYVYIYTHIYNNIDVMHFGHYVPIWELQKLKSPRRYYECMGDYLERNYGELWLRGFTCRAGFRAARGSAWRLQGLGLRTIIWQVLYKRLDEALKPTYTHRALNCMGSSGCLKSFDI